MNVPESEIGVFFVICLSVLRCLDGSLDCKHILRTYASIEIIFCRINRLDVS